MSECKTVVLIKTEMDGSSWKGRDSLLLLI